MITLAADCLVFRLASGESIPFSVEMLSVDLMGETAQWFDPEFVRHAARAVFHYFKQDLDRQTVTVGEFAEALEKVLRGFRPSEPAAAARPDAEPGVQEADLHGLAREASAGGGELFFFPRLRDELRQRLRQSPRLLRFRGLRGCVKELVGVRRWDRRCRTLEEQIVLYLRHCLTADDGRPPELALVVE